MTLSNSFFPAAPSSVEQSIASNEALVTRAPVLNEPGNQNLQSTAKKIGASLLSLGLGFATFPLTVVVHEWGHRIAGILLGDNCNPIIYYKGPLLIGSYVTFYGCNLFLQSGFAVDLAGHRVKIIAIDLAGPLVQIVEVLAVLRFSKSKYTPVVLLPHIAHITVHALVPIFRKRGDYAELLSRAGPIPYAIAVAVSMTPLVLSILSLKSSFFKSEYKTASDKNCKND